MTGVAIVIPMLNEAAGLPRVLRSLAALEPPPAEVLAVDGGSTDASVAIAEAAGLLVVRHETRGRAAAINRGVQEATAPIICVKKERRPSAVLRIEIFAPNAENDLGRASIHSLKDR